MSRTFLAIIMACCVSAASGQCPKGPAPSFWHPDQVDSFKLLYPDCERYTFQSTRVNGEYIKPEQPSGNANLKYLMVLVATLCSIIMLLKFITLRLRYFK